jgi:hypothetical protein
VFPYRPGGQYDNTYFYVFPKDGAASTACKKIGIANIALGASALANAKKSERSEESHLIRFLRLIRVRRRVQNPYLGTPSFSACLSIIHRDCKALSD